MAYINGKEILFSPHITITDGENPYPFYTDDSVAYQKTVPANALPFAVIERVGGMSSVSGGTIHHAAVTAVESKGINRITPNEASFSGTRTIYLPEKLPEGRYFITAEWETDGSSDSVAFNPQYTDGSYFGLLKIARTYTSRTFTAEKPFDRVVVYSDGDGAQPSKSAVCTIRKIMLYASPSADTDGLPYEPYLCVSFGIPEAVQALDGYGMGINAHLYNYIDFAERKYVQQCTRRAAVSGDLTNADVITDGTTTIAPLDTPIFTDISSILPDDNFITASAGGTITFCNADKIAVPSRIEYQTTEEG